MNKIISPRQAIKLSTDLRKSGKSIVLVGGFFDILHVGHIKFLEKAKQKGDFLFVLLEDDEKLRDLKGVDRPINPQKDRANVLSSIRYVDYVILLKKMTNNSKYDKIILRISPNIIAITCPDPNIKHKMRQSKLTGAKVMCVTKRVSDYSTTRLVNLIKDNL